MRFKKLDLNLLVVLNELLAERSTSRAAEKLFLSQPATSNALARLRAHFNDELLVSSGRQLLLTPNAKELVEPVREVLMRIDTAIAAQPVFDPSTETRVFTLLVSDYSTAVLIPPLLETLYVEAPGLRINLRNPFERPSELLEQGDADFLKLWEPPPRIPRLVQVLQWHKHRSTDPAISWIRDKILTVAMRV